MEFEERFKKVEARIRNLECNSTKIDFKWMFQIKDFLKKTPEDCLDEVIVVRMNVKLLRTIMEKRGQ